MQSKAETVDAYFKELPEDRVQAMSQLRKIILKNLPKGFEEQMCYGMPGYVIPLAAYLAGYHVDPSKPLGLVSIASQKNFIALYHMGLYSDPALSDWFTTEFKKRSKARLDMGKSCVRFKNPGDIPFELIGELATKLTPAAWIGIYESSLKKK